MTSAVANGLAYLQCDTCGNHSECISNDNQMRAQRVATTFWSWAVYYEGAWKHACPKCKAEWIAKQ